MKLVILSSLSALLVVSGMFMSALWFLSILGVTLYVGVLYAIPANARREVLKSGWIFGIVYCGAVFSVFWQTLPLTWLGIHDGTLGFALVLSVWASLTLILGIFFALFAALFVRFRTNTVWDIIWISALWTLVQYLQMWGFTVLTIGSSSSWDAHFSALMAGYALAGFSPLLQIASIGGIYLLTYTLCAIGCALYFAWQSYCTTRKRTTSFLIAWCLIGGTLSLADTHFTLVPERVHNETISVALLSTDYTRTDPDALRDVGGREYDTALRVWALDHAPPDIVVFPENAAFFKHASTTPNEYRDAVFGNAPVSFIDTEFVVGQNTKSVQMYFHGDAHSVMYQKMFLSPFGEYIPWLYEFGLKLVLGSTRANLIASAFDLTPGTSLPVAQLGTASVGGLFCSDIFSPSLYRVLTEKGATVLVNAASQSIFQPLGRADTATQMAAQVRAVETGRYLLLSSNGAPSSIISDRGKIVMRSNPGDISVMSTEVPLHDSTTIFVRIGDFILAIFVLLLILPLCIRAKSE